MSGDTAPGRAAVLVALPHGLSVSGVTAWAVRLVNGLTARGRGAGLILHREPAGMARVDVALDPRVSVFDVRDLPALGEGADTGRAVSEAVPRYRAAVEWMYGRWGGPVVVSPNLLGDCYGVCAALTMAMPETVRLVGWRHSDIAYEARVMAHYEPVLARVVGVSAVIAGQLRAAMAGREQDVSEVAYGVEVAAEPVRRAALRGRAVRLAYTGRMEHAQKRVMALVHLSQALRERGVEHRITAVGDGPAAAEFDKTIEGRPELRRVGARGAVEVRGILDQSDVLVLASRYEGLSVSMLEGMARGCVPVVTGVRSGVGQAVEDGVNGVVVEVGAEADDKAVGAALARGVEGLIGSDVGAISTAAWRTVRERYSIERHVDAAERVIDAAAASPSRAWPATRACAFTGGVGGGGGSGTVPADAAERMGRVLEGLAGRRVVIHGAGRHTLELAHVLAKSPATIVAVADDDPQRHGSMLWGWPVVAPADAARAGATDVVISSWIHQDAVWARRGVYEGQGVRVHRLHDSP